VEWTSAKRQEYRLPRQTWTDRRAEAFEVLHLRESAPPELIDAARRCLAKLNHPDVGGDLRQMQAVNAAYDTLMKAA